jgi:hypothetical protein
MTQTTHPHHIFAWQLTRQQIFCKFLESFGFSVDHPHTTYPRGTKNNVFWWRWSTEHELKKYLYKEDKYMVWVGSKLGEGRGTTHPLSPSLLLRKGEFQIHECEFEFS